jgi:hypothetical protein
MSFDLAGIQASSTKFDFGVLGSSCLMLPSSGSLASEIGRERVRHALDTNGHGTAEHSATRGGQEHRHGWGAERST